MIALNGKQWRDLTYADIEKVLSSPDLSESYFLEFKSDDESNNKFIKEVCAFANSYGGYILLGVNNNKGIDGCSKWSELRVNTTIRDSLSPIPIFDVRELKKEEKSVLVVKIEEGFIPPYVTNDGRIFIRVSSSSVPVKSASELEHLYNKRKDYETRISNKIQFPELGQVPPNYCGCIEMGFSLVTNESFEFPKLFLKLDLCKVSEKLKSFKNPYSIARLGDSLVITIGEVHSLSPLGKRLSIPSGLCYMMEIFRDASVRLRIPIISSDNDSGYVDEMVPFMMSYYFEEVYKELVGDDVFTSFILAQKYENLRVFKQFYPIFDSTKYVDSIHRIAFEKRSRDHIEKYGANVVPIGHRIPVAGYDIIDEQEFVKRRIVFSNENLLNWLFFIDFTGMGFIDSIDTSDTQNDSKV